MSRKILKAEAPVWVGRGPVAVVGQKGSVPAGRGIKGIGFEAVVNGQDKPPFEDSVHLLQPFQGLKIYFSALALFLRGAVETQIFGEGGASGVAQSLGERIVLKGYKYFSKPSFRLLDDMNRKRIEQFVGKNTAGILFFGLE